MFQRLATLVPLLFSLSCVGQGMKISQYPSTNQVGPNQLFIITAGGTNMNVRGGVFASALAVVPNTNGFSTNQTHYFDQGPATAQFWIVDGVGTAHAVMGFDNTLDGVVVYDFIGGIGQYWMFTTNKLTSQRVLRATDLGGDLLGSQTVFGAAPATNVMFDASTGNLFRWTMTNQAGFWVTNGTDGQTITLQIMQDNTGIRTGVFVNNTGGTTTNLVRFGTDITGITLTTNSLKTDYIRLKYWAASNYWDVLGFLRGY